MCNENCECDETCDECECEDNPDTPEDEDALTERMYQSGWEPMTDHERWVNANY
jgi:hypothetical protein